MAAAILAITLAAVAAVEWPRPRDYAVEILAVPMRDGVTLHTLVLIPKGTTNRPLLLTRTPFGAAARLRLGEAHLDKVVSPIYRDAARHGDILVFQDIRGRSGSGGRFDMLQPLAADPGRRVDEATDAWDTIDFLVRNLPQSNGRAGVIGFSFDGFTALAALIHPHPSLRAAVAIDPLVDGWTGDDWFHHGAFRQVMIPFVQFMSGTPDIDPAADDYVSALSRGSAGDYAHAVGVDSAAAWQTLLRHPADDAFWRSQAIDARLAAEPRIVPTLFVGSLWDQEDGYGARHAYQAAAARSGAAASQHLVLGPWYHRQSNADGTQTGPLHWKRDTAAEFRTRFLLPFLQAELEGTAAPALPAVAAYETGGGDWQDFAAWPPPGAGATGGGRFYLRAGRQLAGALPAQGEPGADSYVADPADPVPFSPRPVEVISSIGANWPTWMLEDQRAVAGRPDVLTYTTPPLQQALHVAGDPSLTLIAATSGTDADWVVKLLDIYPDDADQAAMQGYALPISMDIFRARYRNDSARAVPLVANQPIPYRLTLPTVSHVFAKGHRIALQIQSSWFPLYDRNPQSFVENIFLAPPQAYQKATQRIFHAADNASEMDLPVRDRN